MAELLADKLIRLERLEKENMELKRENMLLMDGIMDVMKYLCPRCLEMLRKVAAFREILKS